MAGHLFAFLLLLSTQILFEEGKCHENLVFYDKLSAPEPVQGEKEKLNIDGKFFSDGWESQSENGCLIIELNEVIGKEGALEVDLLISDWETANLMSGENSKLHFINMFSNSNGDHHYEDGGTGMDALWTLRSGARDGGLRYGNGFKILHSSHGAKRAPESNYVEKNVTLPKTWDWKADSLYSFHVAWSNSEKYISVRLNSLLCYTGTWENQESLFRYIMLGKSTDFKSLQGVRFSNLKLYARSPEMAGKEKLVLYPKDDFELELANYAPFYRDRGKRSAYVAVDPQKYHVQWARAKSCFKGRSGRYRIVLTAYKEYDGESLYRIKIDNTLLIEQQTTRIASKADEGDELLAWEDVELQENDVLMVEARCHSNKKIAEEGSPGGFGWSRARWKMIEIVPYFH